jgi:enoyl-CoA hydratase/carnithine racemase
VHAADLLLSARPIDAAKAERIGLVNEVVPPGELLPRALAAADAIAANAPLAVAETRRGMRELLHLSLADAWVRQEELGAPLRRSADAAEGARSFVEKRPPRWQGR